MSDRGDVTIELYVGRYKLDEVLARIEAELGGDIEATDFGMTGEGDVIFAETEWLAVENNWGHTDAWAILLAEIPGILGFEIRNSLADGVHCWRWLPDHGVFKTTLDYEIGDVIALDTLQSFMEQARHEPADVQLDALWRLVAESVGWKWIDGLAQLASSVKRPSEQQ